MDGSCKLSVEKPALNGPCICINNCIAIELLANVWIEVFSGVAQIFNVLKITFIMLYHGFPLNPDGYMLLQNTDIILVEPLCIPLPYFIFLLSFNAIIICMCVCFNVYFWESETEYGQGRGRERGRHRIRSRLQAESCQHRARRGASTHEPWDHNLSRNRMLNRLSHPGAP